MIKKTEKFIDHDSLLQLVTSDGEQPPVVVVEGEAGMGKTSLVRFLLAEWARLPEAPNTILGLDQYELLLHFEFRNQFISTFLGFLLFLFDNSSLTLTHEKLIASVLNLRTLVLLDGADEWNKNSLLLLREIIETRIPQSGGKLRLLCTTRPERLNTLLDYVGSLSWVHMRITGVPPDKQFAFVQRSMQRMLEEIDNDASALENPSSISTSKTQIQKLEDFMESSQAKMGEHFKLPLNLPLLAYLWIHHSHRICLATSASELYTAFHDLALKRLLERLVRQKQVGNKKDLERLCNDFLRVLYKVCLAALSQAALQMPQDSTNILELFCNNHDLPPSDMLENCMDVYREWNSNGYLTILAPPHKSKLEFFSAHAVISDICSTRHVQDILDNMQVLLDSHNCPQEARQNILHFAKDEPQAQESNTISQVLQSLHGNTDQLDLSRYQNMLMLMAGIMSHSHPKDLHHYGPQLLDLLRKSGLENYQFLSIVAEAKNDDYIAQLVARQLAHKVRFWVCHLTHSTFLVMIIKCFKIL